MKNSLKYSPISTLRKLLPVRLQLPVKSSSSDQAKDITVTVLDILKTDALSDLKTVSDVDTPSEIAYVSFPKVIGKSKHAYVVTTAGLNVVVETLDEARAIKYKPSLLLDHILTQSSQVKYKDFLPKGMSVRVSNGTEIFTYAINGTGRAFTSHAKAIARYQSDIQAAAIDAGLPTQPVPLAISSKIALDDTGKVTVEFNYDYKGKTQTFSSYTDAIAQFIEDRPVDYLAYQTQMLPEEYRDSLTDGRFIDDTRVKFSSNLLPKWVEIVVEPNNTVTFRYQKYGFLGMGGDYVEAPSWLPGVDPKTGEKHDGLIKTYKDEYPSQLRDYKAALRTRKLLEVQAVEPLGPLPEGMTVRVDDDGVRHYEFTNERGAKQSGTSYEKTIAAFKTAFPDEHAFAFGIGELTITAKGTQFKKSRGHKTPQAYRWTIESDHAESIVTTVSRKRISASTNPKNITKLFTKSRITQLLAGREAAIFKLNINGKTLYAFASTTAFGAVSCDVTGSLKKAQLLQARFLDAYSADRYLESASEDSYLKSLFTSAGSWLDGYTKPIDSYLIGLRREADLAKRTYPRLKTTTDVISVLSIGTSALSGSAYQLASHIAGAINGNLPSYAQGIIPRILQAIAWHKDAGRVVADLLIRAYEYSTGDTVSAENRARLLLFGEYSKQTYDTGKAFHGLAKAGMHRLMTWEIQRQASKFDAQVEEQHSYLITKHLKELSKDSEDSYIKYYTVKEFAEGVSKATGISADDIGKNPAFQLYLETHSDWATHLDVAIQGSVLKTVPDAEELENPSSHTTQTAFAKKVAAHTDIPMSVIQAHPTFRSAFEPVSIPVSTSFLDPYSIAQNTHLPSSLLSTAFENADSVLSLGARAIGFLTVTGALSAVGGKGKISGSRSASVLAFQFGALCLMAGGAKAAAPFDDGKIQALASKITNLKNKGEVTFDTSTESIADMRRNCETLAANTGEHNCEDIRTSGFACSGIEATFDAPPSGVSQQQMSEICIQLAKKAAIDTTGTDYPYTAAAVLQSGGTFKEIQDHVARISAFDQFIINQGLNETTLVNATAYLTLNASIQQRILNQHTSELNLTRTDLSALTTRVGTAEADIIGLGGRIDSVNASHSALTTRVSGLETTSTNHSSRLDSLESRTTGTETAISGLTTRTSSLESGQSAHGSTLASHATQIAALNTAAGFSNTSILSLVDDVTNNTATLNGFKTQINLTYINAGGPSLGSLAGNALLNAQLDWLLSRDPGTDLQSGINSVFTTYFPQLNSTLTLPASPTPSQIANAQLEAMMANIAVRVGSLEGSIGTLFDQINASATASSISVNTTGSIADVRARQLGALLEQGGTRGLAIGLAIDTAYTSQFSHLNVNVTGLSPADATRVRFEAMQTDMAIRMVSVESAVQQLNIQINATALDLGVTVNETGKTSAQIQAEKLGIILRESGGRAFAVADAINTVYGTKFPTLPTSYTGSNPDQIIQSRFEAMLSNITDRVQATETSISTLLNQIDTSATTAGISVSSSGSTDQVRARQLDALLLRDDPTAAALGESIDTVFTTHFNHLNGTLAGLSGTNRTKTQFEQMMVSLALRTGDHDLAFGQLMDVVNATYAQSGFTPIPSSGLSDREVFHLQLGRLLGSNLTPSTNITQLYIDELVNNPRFSNVVSLVDTSSLSGFEATMAKFKAVILDIDRRVLGQEQNAGSYAQFQIALYAQFETEITSVVTAPVTSGMNQVDEGAAKHNATLRWMANTMSENAALIRTLHAALFPDQNAQSQSRKVSAQSTSASALSTPSSTKSVPEMNKEILELLRNAELQNSGEIRQVGGTVDGMGGRIDTAEESGTAGYASVIALGLAGSLLFCCLCCSSTGQRWTGRKIREIAELIDGGNNDQMSLARKTTVSQIVNKVEGYAIGEKRLLQRALRAMAADMDSHELNQLSDEFDEADTLDALRTQIHSTCNRIDNDNGNHDIRNAHPIIDIIKVTHDIMRGFNRDRLSRNDQRDYDELANDIIEFALGTDDIAPLDMVAVGSLNLTQLRINLTAAADANGNGYLPLGSMRAVQKRLFAETLMRKGIVTNDGPLRRRLQTLIDPVADDNHDFIDDKFANGPVPALQKNQIAAALTVYFSAVDRDADAGATGQLWTDLLAYFRDNGRFGDDDTITGDANNGTTAFTFAHVDNANNADELTVARLQAKLDAVARANAKATIYAAANFDPQNPGLDGDLDGLMDALLANKAYTDITKANGTLGLFDGIDTVIGIRQMIACLTVYESATDLDNDDDADGTLWNNLHTYFVGNARFGDQAAIDGDANNGTTAFQAGNLDDNDLNGGNITVVALQNKLNAVARQNAVATIRAQGADFNAGNDGDLAGLINNLLNNRTFNEIYAADTGIVPQFNGLNTVLEIRQQIAVFTVYNSATDLDNDDDANEVLWNNLRTYFIGNAQFGDQAAITGDANNGTTAFQAGNLDNNDLNGGNITVVALQNQLNAVTRANAKTTIYAAIAGFDPQNPGPNNGDLDGLMDGLLAGKTYTDITAANVGILARFNGANDVLTVRQTIGALHVLYTATDLDLSQVPSQTLQGGLRAYFANNLAFNNQGAITGDNDSGITAFTYPNVAGANNADDLTVARLQARLDELDDDASSSSSDDDDDDDFNPGGGGDPHAGAPGPRGPHGPFSGPGSDHHSASGGSSSRVELANLGGGRSRAGGSQMDGHLSDHQTQGINLAAELLPSRKRHKQFALVSNFLIKLLDPKIAGGNQDEVDSAEEWKPIVDEFRQRYTDNIEHLILDAENDAIQAEMHELVAFALNDLLKKDESAPSQKRLTAALAGIKDGLATPNALNRIKRITGLDLSQHDYQVMLGKAEKAARKKLGFPPLSSASTSSRADAYRVHSGPRALSSQAPDIARRIRAELGLATSELKTADRLTSVIDQRLAMGIAETTILQCFNKSTDSLADVTTKIKALTPPRSRRRTTRAQTVVGITLPNPTRDTDIAAIQAFHKNHLTSTDNETAINQMIKNTITQLYTRCTTMKLTTTNIRGYFTADYMTTGSGQKQSTQRYFESRADMYVTTYLNAHLDEDSSASNSDEAEPSGTSRSTATQSLVNGTDRLSDSLVRQKLAYTLLNRYSSTLFPFPCETQQHYINKITELSNPKTKTNVVTYSTGASQPEITQVPTFQTVADALTWFSALDRALDSVAKYLETSNPAGNLATWITRLMQTECGEKEIEGHLELAVDIWDTWAGEARPSLAIVIDAVVHTRELRGSGSNKKIGYRDLKDVRAHFFSTAKLTSGSGKGLVCAIYYRNKLVPAKHKFSETDPFIGPSHLEAGSTGSVPMMANPMTQNEVERVFYPLALDTKELQMLLRMAKENQLAQFNQYRQTSKKRELTTQDLANIAQIIKAHPLKFSDLVTKFTKPNPVMMRTSGHSTDGAERKNPGRLTPTPQPVNTDQLVTLFSKQVEKYGLKFTKDDLNELAADSSADAGLIAYLIGDTSTHPIPEVPRKQILSSLQGPSDSDSDSAWTDFEERAIAHFRTEFNKATALVRQFAQSEEPDGTILESFFTPLSENQFAALMQWKGNAQFIVEINRFIRITESTFEIPKPFADFMRLNDQTTDPLFVHGYLTATTDASDDSDPGDESPLLPGTVSFDELEEIEFEVDLSAGGEGDDVDPTRALLDSASV